LLIAGPNLTIDRTSTIPALRPGEVLRLADVVVTPGGKGLNVARAALALRVPAALVAFLPGHTGRAVAALVAEEGVTLQGVPCAGEVRSTSVILEPGRTTVLNEPGPKLDLAAWVELEGVIDDSLPDHGVLVCSGSLPPGVPVDGYARLLARARDAGKHCVVDANGPALAAAVAAGADVVTPNLAEAEGVDEPVEAVADARPRALAAARALVHQGARAAVVTAAAAGAAVAWAGEPAWLDAPRAHVRNPIGAGDAFTCGLAAALERGASVLEAAREGVAAGAASVETARAGTLDAGRMRELLA
jgi:1-phosphofructokinase family hexose kinase